VRIVGKGTFGVVYYATLQSTGEDVAIKKVIQDENYKNRELEIIKDLDHPNVVRMLHYYFTREAKEVEAEGNREDVYLHLFMEYVPEDLFKMIRFFHKSDRQSFPSILIKAYSYQILRGLAYLKDCGICHRDIKPRNLLINPKTH
jgi:serine/threonine protein kinase